MSWPLSGDCAEQALYINRMTSGHYGRNVTQHKMTLPCSAWFCDVIYVFEACFWDESFDPATDACWLLCFASWADNGPRMIHASYKV